MSVLIIGGCICGLGAALLLARDGHEVTVLEQGVGAIPETSFAAWQHSQRKGVAQFRQPHNFMPGLRLLLEKELPDIQDALGRAGPAKFDLRRPGAAEAIRAARKAMNDSPVQIPGPNRRQLSERVQ